jgi:hypothetical protein
MDTRSPWALLGSGKGVLALWRQLLGADFEAARQFLRATDEQEENSFPCMSHFKCSCDHRVIIHSASKIVAACRCQDGCLDGVLELTPKDLMLWKVDATKLCEAIGSAFGLERHGNRVSNDTITRRIGNWGKTQSPVFFCQPTSQAKVLEEMEALFAATNGRFILVVPTPAYLTREVESALTRHRCIAIPLSDVLAITGEGLVVMKSIAPILQEFECRLGEDTNGMAKVMEKIGREVAMIRKQTQTKTDNEPLDENVARQVFAVIQQMEDEGESRKAPLIKVFRLYCMQNLTRDEVAKRCGCVPSLISLRLKQLEQRMGRKPSELRQFSSQFERMADSMSDPRAKKINRRQLANEVREPEDDWS